MPFHFSRRWLTTTLLCGVSAVAISCGGDGSTVAPESIGNHSASLGGGGGDMAWRAMDSGTTELLWSVWGAALDDAIAVGTLGTADHLGANAWSLKPTGTTRDLCAVWTTSDGRGIAVGLGGTILGYPGTQWEPMTSGTGAGLFDVWGFEDYQAVAVGEGGTVLRFDGTAWSSMVSSTDVGLFGVWGASPGDVYAVGVGGTIVHYDGSAWDFMTSPAAENLSAVWGSSAGNIWSVGDKGTLIHYDGSAWAPVDAGTAANLYDVWGSAEGDVWAVGAGGTILHYDGAQWAPVQSGTGKDLCGVWGRSAGEAYACGADGTILRYGEEAAPELILVCHDHPDGDAGPPAYGLRLDNLMDTGRYTFSFDYFDDTETARVVLTLDSDPSRIRIHGRAYGGKVSDGQWEESSRGWIDVDFTYAARIEVKDDCGLIEGDDLHVTAEDAVNHGAIVLDGWGGNQVFSFSDKSGDMGCSFILDNDTDSKGNAPLADDPATWSGSGWLRPDTNGSRDWLFIARDE